MPLIGQKGSGRCLHLSLASDFEDPGVPAITNTDKGDMKRGMSKVATDYLRVFIECQSNYYIHANSWIVQ